MHHTCASAIIVLAAVVVSGCSKPVVFRGTSPLAIAGTPPSAPDPAPPPRVEVRDNKIEIREKIQFDFDKATIRPESFGLMNEIADVMAKNAQLRRIRIEGHASSEGSARHNKQLSDARAKSVMAYLVEHGIAAGRLTAEGYGVDRPIADNETEAGREQNRRVEFVIVEQDVTTRKVEIDPATGAEKVLEENRQTVTAPGAAGSTGGAR